MTGLDPLLVVEHLSVEFPTDDGALHAVDDVSFAVMPHETLGIVGESGSGKTVTSMAVLGLLPTRARVSGAVRFRGQDLLGMREKDLEKIRGAKIAMVFQDALTALNPAYTVGDQIAEAVTVHNQIGRDALATRVRELLTLVGIPNPSERAEQFPHEYSGGMRQRAMIAMSIANDPDLLIADEPTTALDVTVQAQILDLIDSLRSEFGAAVIIITHDLGVVAEHCDNIQVMYAGRAIEYGRTDDIFYHPHHPYTWGLLQSIPKLGSETDRLTPIRGLPPSLINLPRGCSFAPRCPYVFDRCREEAPELLPSDTFHASACHLSLADKERIAAEEVLASL